MLRETKSYCPNWYKAIVHIGKSWGLKYKKSVKVIQCSISAQAWLVCKMWKCFEVDRIKKKTNYISVNCRICFCWFVWDYKEVGVGSKIQILYTQTFYFKQCSHLTKSLNSSTQCNKFCQWVVHSTFNH